MTKALYTAPSPSAKRVSTLLPVAVGFKNSLEWLTLMPFPTTRGRRSRVTSSNYRKRPQPSHHYSSVWLSSQRLCNPTLPENLMLTKTLSRFTQGVRYFFEHLAFTTFVILKKLPTFVFSSILISENFVTFCFVTYPQFLEFFATLVCNMKYCKWCTKKAKVILKSTKLRNAGIRGYCCSSTHTIEKPGENLIGISISTFQIPKPTTQKPFEIDARTKTHF